MSQPADHEAPHHPNRVEPRAHQGMRLGKYKLIRPLGSGGMAQVFEAEKPLLEGILARASKIVALKMSADLLGADKQLTDSLLNELKIASMLNHSNIVHVFDASFIHGILVVELERIDGMDLAVMLESMRERQSEMSVEMAVYIVRGILEGLHHAHTLRAPEAPEGIIHRDLSPHNVLISSAGEVKIMDFGIGKFVHDKTSARFVKGKARYMSPEHAEGKAGAQADLFSVGAILYEMLEGRPFRERGEPYAMIAAAAALPAPPLERDDIPDPIRRAYEKATARDLSARFANASEFLRRLSSFLGNEVRAQEMRTFYERQLDRGRHTGYTQSSIAVPEGFFRLIEAIKTANAKDGEAPSPADDPVLQAAQRQALAVAQQARRLGPDLARHGLPPVPEADAPAQRRRSSGLGERGPDPLVSGTIDAPPLHLRGKAQPAMVPPAVVSPSEGEAFGPSGTAVLEHAGPSGSTRPSTTILERTAPASRVREHSEPVWDPTGQTPRPVLREEVALGEGTLFVVAGSNPRRMKIAIASAGGVSVALAVVLGWWLTRDLTVEKAPAADAEQLQVAELAGAEPPERADASREWAAEPSGPVLDPIVPSLEIAAPAAVAASPAIEAPMVPPPAAQPAPPPATLGETSPAAVEPVPATPPTPASTTAASTSKPTPRSKPAKKKAMIEVRLAPNFAEGEIKIGKRTWVVKSTFDVPILEGRYALAWRSDASSPWQSAGEIVLVPGLRYFIRLGKGGLIVSSSPAKGASK